MAMCTYCPATLASDHSVSLYKLYEYTVCHHGAPTPCLRPHLPKHCYKLCIAPWPHNQGTSSSPAGKQAKQCPLSITFTHTPHRCLAPWLRTIIAFGQPLLWVQRVFRTSPNPSNLRPVQVCFFPPFFPPSFLPSHADRFLNDQYVYYRKIREMEKVQN